MKMFTLTILLLAFSGTLHANEKTKVKATQVYSTIKLRMPVGMVQPAQPAVGLENTWWIVEQKGRILRFDGNQKEPTTEVVLDITKNVTSGGERGLLGLAFHPKFAVNGWVFVNYTPTVDGQLKTRISRFSSADQGKTLDPKSEQVVLEFDQPYGNHNGGHIAFGHDGRLYIGIGDGGAAGDPKDHGQNAKTLLGTIARINVDQLPYTVPADNPFVAKDGRPEIFAWGLRNPWKFSFDRLSGALWAADVGQNAWEEVNIIQRGKNYGWRVLEGTHCYNPSEDCPREGFELPVVEYSHKEGQSVTGGFVYRGKKLTGFEGHYIFGDFVSGKIWAFNPETKERTLILDSKANVSTFVEARDGELGFMDYQSGKIFSLEPHK